MRREREGLSHCELQIEPLACHQIAAGLGSRFINGIKINVKIRESLLPRNPLAVTKRVCLRVDFFILLLW